MVACPKCGHQNEDAARNCASCRINLEWALENTGLFEEVPAGRPVSKEGSGPLVAIAVMLGVVLLGGCCVTFAPLLVSQKASWTCAEYYQPYEFMQLKAYRVSIFAGSSYPQLNNVRGYAGTDSSHGAIVGIEGRCNGNSGQGTYYYVRGVHRSEVRAQPKLWQGWVHAGDVCDVHN